MGQLHANNWRRSYRGILRDDYLDGPLVQDRQALWKCRLSSQNFENRSVWVLEEAGELEAFVCVLLDANRDWGALLESLHVSTAWQRRGLGTRLVAMAQEWVRSMRPCSGLYLWVGEENTAARRFYEHLDGQVLGHRVQSAPDGTRVAVVAYGWRGAPRSCPI
jgi:GNAT superfamily N-acetyltransferase